MTQPVKGKRRYDSTRRREQAAATGREILEAAQRLFEERGYAATTMAAIAAEAGVALKTVYVAFGTKSGVLRSLWHLRLRGDEDDVPVGERQWFRDVLEEPDPERQLRLTARNSRAVKLRAANLMRIMRDAAGGGDADIAALWQRIQDDFYANQRSIVDALADKHALAPGLDAARAADILWTLNHPDLWHLLVGERGWSADEYERWFGDAVCAQLLGR
jgi:AcrR family transcriptional regulator